MAKGYNTRSQANTTTQRDDRFKVLLNAAKRKADLLIQTPGAPFYVHTLVQTFFSQIAWPLIFFDRCARRSRKKNCRANLTQGTRVPFNYCL